MKSVTLPNLSYRLTTAEILYHLPDHPHLLQTFVWQQLDRAPDFPALHRFLDYWRRDIAAKLHSIRIAQTPVLSDSNFRYAGVALRLH